MDDLLDELHGSLYFSKIDLKSGYHQIRISEIMPFGLSNASITFMSLLNHVLRHLIGHCVAVCFDDVLAYNTCLDEYLMHVFLLALKESRRFVKDFSTIADFLKLVKYVGQERDFKDLNPILAFPNFAKSFKMKCDALNLGIRFVLFQERHPIAKFSEKLKGSYLNYSTHDKELYALVRTLQVWQHYLIPKEFVIHSDHETLKHVEAKTSSTKGMPNGLNYIKELYVNVDDFGNVFALCVNSAYGGYFRHEGFLFMEKRLCVPKGSIT
ncbi:Retrovirus-related Pol polyprotein, partial [Mucuna pruriens]